MNLTVNPDANAFTSVLVKLTLLPGFRINEKSLSTGWLLRYFKPNHKRRVDTLSGVISTGFMSGPEVDPFCTDEMNPSLYNCKATWRCRREKGTEVVEIFTRVQFLTCDAKCARLTKDISSGECLKRGITNGYLRLFSMTSKLKN